MIYGAKLTIIKLPSSTRFIKKTYYLTLMASKLDIIYNENCPVCRFEIKHYQDYVSKNQLSVNFIDLNTYDLTKWNISKDEAAKQLIAIQDGKTLKGIDAFGLLWTTMPRYKFLAYLVEIPMLNYCAHKIYDHILAPIIYQMHKKREIRAKNISHPS